MDELNKNDALQDDQPDQTEQQANATAQVDAQNEVNDADAASHDSSQETADVVVSGENAVVSDAEEEDEEVEPMPVYVSKLTPAQSKFVQWFLGIGAGFLIWFFLYVGSEHQGELLSWMWVIVFAVVMLTRNILQTKKGMNLQLFTKAFMIGLIIFLAIFIIMGAVTGKFTNN